uniref:Reverse transcriptase domain-containing protein n=1 Tax=Ananas comosus var. bracteatus TaxID=296719 RepID=A0A6V7NI64_ANACO|nr:unnamed protein product [Ananas comosus var. bracteatus]
MMVFTNFYNGSDNLEGFNSSWLCFIPKKSNVNYASDYRPISLVHSLAKIISKVLANRLQNFMDQLINPFQAAFTKGCHILDNFYAAHILIHDLYSTKQQAALLKLDFERAFGNINWIFLTNLLQARGFGDRWTCWITSLQQSATTAVLLNGVQGKTFTCKRGLR